MKATACVLFFLFACTTSAMAFDCPMGEQGQLVVANWTAQSMEGGTSIEARLRNVSGRPIASAFGRLFISPEAEPAGMLVIQQPLGIDEEVTIVNVATTVYGAAFDFEAAASRQGSLVACLTQVEFSGN